MNDRGSHEAYSFVCLGCGRGWEQTYEIRHATDVSGRPLTEYHADGVHVPSPLAHPRCPSCTSTQIRILRPGRVDGAKP